MDDDIGVYIVVGRHGDNWLVSAIDGEEELLAEAVGPRAASVQAVCEEARSYLAGEDGWEES